MLKKISYYRKPTSMIEGRFYNVREEVIEYRLFGILVYQSVEG